MSDERGAGGGRAAPVSFTLKRDAYGRLVFHGADGLAVEGALPVRAFPITGPQEGLAIVAPGGRELAWVDRLDELDSASRALVEEELALREFSPRIRRIASVSGYATPCTWEVDTDRGQARFVLNGEEFIRRLPAGVLLIADSNGVNWTIEAVSSLDRASRKILDRFL